jgi:hypothetical protein
MQNLSEKRLNVIYVNVEFANYKTNTFETLCKNIKLQFPLNVEINNKNLEKAFKIQHAKLYSKIPQTRNNKNAIAVSVIRTQFFRDKIGVRN